MTTVLSRKRRSPNNKLSELLWEPNDSYTLTPEDLARGWFEHQLVHPRINYKLLVRCKVNSSEYPFTSMIVDETTGIVHVTLGGWETVAEDVKFQYYYRHGGRLVPAPDPVPTEYIVPQAMYSYDPGAPIPGGWVGQPISVAHPSYYGSPIGLARWAWWWTLPEDYPTFAELGIYGIKIRATLAGTGIIGFVWNINDPGYGVPGGWPDAGDGAGSHVTLDSYWGDDSLPGDLHVVPADGLKTWEHEFPVNNTATDPYFEGWNYLNLLEKLEMSLHTGGETWNNVDGYLTADGPDAMDVQIFSFDLILMGLS